MGTGARSTPNSVKLDTSVGRRDVRFATEVSQITPGSVTLSTRSAPQVQNNDAVIACACRISPIEFLRNVRVMIETNFGTA